MSVRDNAMTVIVDSDSIRVVSAGTMGPASLAAGDVIAGADEIIVGTGVGTATTIPNVVYARTKGATGGGSTDDTVDIATAQTAAATRASADKRATLAFSPGDTHKIDRLVGQKDGGVRLEQGVSLDGQGAKLSLVGNAAFVTNHWPIVAGDNDSNGGGYVADTQATITANVAVNATQFTVNSTTGFAAGNEVMVRLNDNPTDAAEVKDWYFAKVKSVDSGTLITLDRPSPYACTVASQAAINKLIQKLVKPTDDGYVGNLTMTTDIGGGGTAEAGVDLRWVRNWTVENIVTDDPGAGTVLLGYADGVTIRNIRTRQSGKMGSAAKGRVISMWNCNNINIENVYAEYFETKPFFIESYSRGIVVDGVHLVNNHPDRVQTSDAFFFVTQGSDFTARNVLIEGTGGGDLTDTGGTSGNNIRIENLWLNTATQLKSVATDQLYGSLRIGQTVYGALKAVSVPFRVDPAQPGGWAGAFDLPTGLYRRVYAYVSSTTGIDAAVISAGGSDKNITGFLSTGVMVDCGCGYGTDYPFNNTDAKTFAYHTDGTTPAGTTGFLYLEYWPSVVDDNTDGRQQLAMLNAPAYTVTNHTDARSLNETGATTAQVANTLGTLIADLRRSGWIA